MKTNYKEGMKMRAEELISEMKKMEDLKNWLERRIEETNKEIALAELEGRKDIIEMCEVEKKTYEKVLTRIEIAEER